VRATFTALHTLYLIHTAPQHHIYHANGRLRMYRRTACAPHLPAVSSTYALLRRPVRSGPRHINHASQRSHTARSGRGDLHLGGISYSTRSRSPTPHLRAGQQRQCASLPVPLSPHRVPPQKSATCVGGRGPPFADGPLCMHGGCILLHPRPCHLLMRLLHAAIIRPTANISPSRTRSRPWRMPQNNTTTPTHNDGCALDARAHTMNIQRPLPHHNGARGHGGPWRVQGRLVNVKVG